MNRYVNYKKSRGPKSPYSIWVAIIIVMILVSLVIVYIQNRNKPLDAYTQDNTVGSTVQATTTVPLDNIKNDKINLSIGLSKDKWTHVTKSGHDAYILENGTSVEIEITDFNKDELSVNEGTEKTRLSVDGYILKSFNWIDTSSYALAYQNDDYSYMAYNSYDKKYNLKVTITIPNNQYDSMIDKCVAIFDSIKWKKDKPYPTDMKLYYSKIGNFIYGLPSGWNLSTANNVISAQNSEDGTTISVYLEDSKDTYSKFTKVEYVNLASNGRNGYALLDFQKTDDNYIKAKGSYLVDNTEYIVEHYLVANGKYKYTITIDTTSSSYNNKDYLDKVVDCFKLY